MAEKIHGAQVADRIHVFIELQPETSRRMSREAVNALRGKIVSEEPMKSLIARREAVAKHWAQEQPETKREAS
jgi:hypothetical protein